METNQIPEKIYINPNLENRTWLIGKGDTSFIEYTRTDAFIENAVEWWMDNFIYTDDVKIKYDTIQSFKNYLKGE